MRAAANGKLEFVTLLIASGANLFLQDIRGYTALDWFDWVQIYTNFDGSFWHIFCSNLEPATRSRTQVEDMLKILILWIISNDR